MDSLATRFKNAIDGQTCIFGIAALFSLASIVAPIAGIGSKPEWEETPNQKAKEALVAHVQQFYQKQYIFISDTDAREMASSIMKDMQKDHFDAKQGDDFHLLPNRHLSMSEEEIEQARIEYALAAAEHSTDVQEYVGAQKRAPETQTGMAFLTLMVSLFGAGVRIKNNMDKQKYQPRPSLG